MKLVVAASGGVAAVKTPALVRRLAEKGHEVKAAATDDALHFVTKLSLAVAAGSPILDRAAWFAPDGHVHHLELARWAEALIVAPATADALASAATGRADDVISALILAGIAKVVWAPAMNTAMWQHPAVQHNAKVLESYGHRLIGPAEGPLAAKHEGSGLGRMVEPEDIVLQLERIFKPQDLAAHHVLVSAGPTREYLDPVRFISNPSSGRMGFAVAEAARDRGAKVTLVAGPTSLPAPYGILVKQVESAQEMLQALSESFDGASILIMAAAVADWRAPEIASEKQAKMGERQVLELVRTLDILETLAQRKKTQVMVGFAMETHEGVARAAEKARRKSLDFICLNYPTREGTPFGGEMNQLTLVRQSGESEALPRMAKREAADVILSRALACKETAHSV